MRQRPRGLPELSFLRADAAHVFASCAPGRVNEGRPAPVFAPLILAFSFLGLSSPSGWDHGEQGPSAPSFVAPLGGPLCFYISARRSDR